MGIRAFFFDFFCPLMKCSSRFLYLQALYALFVPTDGRKEWHLDPVNLGRDFAYYIASLVMLLVSSKAKGI